MFSSFGGNSTFSTASTTTSSSSFSFGSFSNKPLTTMATTSASGLFGAGGVSSTGLFSSTTSSGGGLFSSSSTTAGGLFSSVTPTTTTSSLSSLFGVAAPTSSTSSSFGGGSLFGGSTTTSASSLFGGSSSIFGTQPTTASSLLVQPANSLLTVSQSTTPAESVNSTVARILVEGKPYSDDRDAIIRSFNCLQVVFGFGSVIETPEKSIDIDQSNEGGDFGAFKTYTYNVRPPRSPHNQDIVTLVFNTKIPELLAHKQDILDALSKLFDMGTKGCVVYDGIFPISETKTVVYIHLIEYGLQQDKNCADAISKRIPAETVISFMDKQLKANAPATIGITLSTSNSARDQLKKLNLEDYCAKRQWTDAEVETYLAVPPSGISKDLWTNAINENPDPKRLIPFPLIGFEERQKIQKLQREINSTKIERLKEQVREIKQSSVEMTTKAKELMNWQKHFERRIFEVIMKIESESRSNATLTIEEAKLRNRILDMWKMLNAPENGMKARLAKAKFEWESQKIRDGGPVNSNTYKHTKQQLDPLETGEQEHYLTSSMTDSVLYIQKGLENISNILRMTEKALKQTEDVQESRT